MPTALLLGTTSAFQRSLAHWYRTSQRPLPWRQAPSLYKTVVSEFMLQQTQVKTVLPYFARWLHELPDFHALAAAPEDKVVKLWEGLGYYTRARNLHKLAQQLVALPEVPRSPEAWRELPGIGPYTAAAITSITFSYPAAVIDGNVVRILARLTSEDTSFRDSGTAAKAMTPLAQALLDPSCPGDHNQAMMELGATVCTRHNPLCTLCPVRDFCTAAQRGTAEDYPKLDAKKIEQRTVLRLWHLHEGLLLLHRTPTTARRLADMYELPSAEHLDLPSSVVTALPLLQRKKRGITRYQITEPIHRLPAALLRTSPLPEDLHRIPLALLDSITLSGPHRRWVTALLSLENKKARS